MGRELRGIEYMRQIRFTPEEEKRLQITTRANLCKLRRRSMGNMTQKEYAEWAGVSLSVIQKLESDRPYSPCWTNAKLMKLLGVNWDFVLDFVCWAMEEQPKPEQSNKMQIKEEEGLLYPSARYVAASIAD